VRKKKVHVPIRFVLDSGQSLVVLTHEGDPNLIEMLNVLEGLLGRETLGPAFRFLEDRRGRSTPVATSYVRGLSSYLGAEDAFRGTRWAVVVDPARIASYGMGRMQEILLESAHVDAAVFDDVGKALAWLRPSSEPPRRVDDDGSEGSPGDCP
jgi:hypothetical protein